MQSEVRIPHGKRICARQRAWIHMGLYTHHFQQKSVYISKSSNFGGLGKHIYLQSDIMKLGHKIIHSSMYKSYSPTSQGIYDVMY